MIELPDAHHVGCRCHEAVQKLLCGVLRNVVGILKLGETSSKQLCHKFMTYLLSLLKKFPTGLARQDMLGEMERTARERFPECKPVVTKFVTRIIWETKSDTQ